MTVVLMTNGMMVYSNPHTLEWLPHLNSLYTQWYRTTPLNWGIP
jgi:hypothetical protein